MRPKIVSPNDNNVAVKMVPADNVQFFCTTCKDPYRVNTVKTRNKITTFILSCDQCNKLPSSFTKAVFIKMYHILPEELQVISKKIRQTENGLPVQVYD